MRIERRGFSTTASGDLYRHWLFNAFRGRRAIREPDPAAGIPTFPINKYAYYLRVTRILEAFTISNGFTLGFEMHRLNDASNNSWTNAGSYAARMEWRTAPAAFPDATAYLEGEVSDRNGQPAGWLTMGWVSPYLRKATFELDSVAGSPQATDSGVGHTWTSVFDQVGWEVDIDQSNTNIVEPGGASWSNGEMHAELLASRDAADLDKEWRYHLLHVRQLDSTSRGIMYDAYGGDSNNIPREGAGIASDWTFPAETRWGALQRTRFGDADGPYFRTAVHELGHAFGLHHNSADSNTRIMNTTGTIASSGVTAGVATFPGNIDYVFEANDAKKLRHWPDIRVRPGGIPFGQSYSGTPLSPNDDARYDTSMEVPISVKPLLDVVPLGAPVRIDLTLENRNGADAAVPPSLGLSGGFTSGRVIGPSGVARVFHPLVVCLDDNDLTALEDGDSIDGAMTLLRGPDGALFQAPGLHVIEVDADWEVGDVAVRSTGRASVMVTPPVDDHHASAARAVLDEPDLLLTLAIGGDHLVDGLAALDEAMACGALAPHFAVIKAKQVGRRFGGRAADAEAAAKLVDADTVMSGRELVRTAELLEGTRKATRAKAAVKDMVQTLSDRADALGLDDETKTMLKDI